MAVRGVDPNEEKKSYGTVFFVGSILLVVVSLWAIFDDNITRRVWKIHQAEFISTDYERAAAALVKEQERLNAEPKYAELVKQRAAEVESLESGEKGARLAELLELRQRVEVEYFDADQEVKFVKSELDEAWYEFDHAVQLGQDAGPYRRHIQDLQAQQRALEPALEAARKKRTDVRAEIREVQGGVKKIDEQLYELEGDKRKWQRQMDNAIVTVGPEGFPQFTLYKVPSIQQVVLKDFDRNNFDQHVDRVDRCQSCHIGINRAGFDDLPQPLTTHPKRTVFLGDTAHPPRVFGCTACHDGQGEAVNSTAQAHGNVKFWEHPLHEDHDVEASCVTCHINVAGLEGAEVVARGQQIFEQVGCTGCHLVEGYADIPKVGPSLRKVQAKLDPGWMVDWIENPREFRPYTRMPHFYFKEDEALAAAAYLWSVSGKESDAWLKDNAAPEGYQPGDAAMVEKGRELARSVGCLGCHGFAEDEFTTRVGGKDLVPNLKDIAAKANPRWTYNWLLDPKSYNPETRMPSLRLSADEALALTTYLMTLGEKPEPDAAVVARLEDPANVAKGEKLVRKYGCAGCHDIPGMENESRIGVELTTFGSKPLEELFFGNDTSIKHSWKDWTYNKILSPRVYATERVEQLMPHFDLPEEDIEAVRVLLRGFIERKVPESFKADHAERAQQILAGRRKVQEYNCIGCHEIDGMGGYVRKYYEQNPTLAPPPLNGEGEKVQANWLFGFLQNPEDPIRPWLKVRMPTFGFDGPHADTFVNYFAGLSEVEIPYVHVDEAQVPAGYLEAGQTLFSDDYFECGSCHVQGDKTPEGPVEDWAPDLNLARQRLNPDWIEKWILDPQTLQPGTKMPSFYPGGPEDILGGDENKQIEALTDYIMTLGLQPATAAKADAAPSAESSEQPAVEGQSNQG
ncbi:MAG: c-type cytochrome [Deltaproteobacteria bacterium]|nr:c-type cytochrome [Deltaproteobacteria bacterium]